MVDGRINPKFMGHFITKHDLFKVHFRTVLNFIPLSLLLFLTLHKTDVQLLSYHNK